jgi:ABC-type lipoprotein export system ATPase subunit
MNKLELKNIYKSYNSGFLKQDVLSNFSLSLNDGEILSLTGASGSGKSTLLHIMGLLDQPDSGKLFIGDLDTFNMSDNEKAQLRLSKIGFIYQQYHLLPDFSARENIALPHLILYNDMNLALKKADSLLEELGLYNKKHNLPGELSGGQQQRVAVAKAIINDPQILLADEPTGNLDSTNSENLLNLLQKLVSTKNISVIIATHDKEVAKISTRNINLSDV